jgi:hypothetical protein
MTRLWSTIPELTRRLARLPSRLLWGLVAVLISCIPVTGALSTTRIFCLRDLSFYFWPEHLWLRNSLMNGEFPMWDPYVGFGQAALSDPVRHILHPAIALLRFVPSEVVGFNLAVALPVPIAAVGMYLFLNRRVGTSAAALGSIAFAASGPMLSTANMLNFSWAAASLPWVFLAVDSMIERHSPRGFALASIAYAMLFLAGEGPTVVGGGILTAVYALASSPRGERLRASIRVSAAGICGVALAGVLSIPFIFATLGSLRARGMDPRVPAFWSLHPLTTLQSFSYGILGNPTGTAGRQGWIAFLNSYPEPFVYSVFLGIGVLVLALLGLFAERRDWNIWFWGIAACISLFMAFGRYAPFYGAVRSILPIADALRFPVKFVLLTAFALAVLSAYGWEQLVGDRPGKSGATGPSRSFRSVRWIVVGIAASAALGAALVSGGVLTPALSSLAGSVGALDAGAAASFLVDSLKVALPRLFLLSAGLAGAFVLVEHSEKLRRYGLAIIFVTATLDPVLAGINLFPMVDVKSVAEPSWAAQVRESGARIYIGGRLQFVVDRTPDPDDVKLDAGLPLVGDTYFESIAAFSTYSASFPSAWRVRDSFSFDNAMLWPREYWRTRDCFRSAPNADRRRFLEKAGVGFYLVTWKEVPGASIVERKPGMEPMALWKVDVPQPRAQVKTEWAVEEDAATAISRCVEDREAVLVDRLPEPSGDQGPPGEAAATIRNESSGAVSIAATAPDGGGMLVLRDSYADGWNVSVDGRPAAILRADGIFRAVRLSAGIHRVEFSYEPPGFRIGIGLTSLTALGLALFVAIGRRPEQ